MKSLSVFEVMMERIKGFTNVYYKGKKSIQL